MRRYKCTGGNSVSGIRPVGDISFSLKTFLVIFSLNTGVDLKLFSALIPPLNMTWTETFLLKFWMYLT